MNKLKLIVPLLLMLVLALPVRAEHLPEKNVINKELIIEKDSNVVKDNLEGKNDEEFDYESSNIRIFFSKKEYLKKVALPSVLIFSSGLLIFAVSETKKYILKTKKDS